MNIFGMMDISASALKAERVRAEVVASNMANAETTRTEDGVPYQRKHVVFAEQGHGFQDSLLGQSSLVPVVDTPFRSNLLGTTPDRASGGVEVAGVISDNSAPLRRFDPGNPDAGPDGYVAYPDINPLTEMVDLMGANRAYGMNASAVQAEKEIFTSSLDILKA